MNDVPLLFAETVVRLLDAKMLQNLMDANSGLFGNAGRSFWENRLRIYLNVVYNSTAKTCEYCLSCIRTTNSSPNGLEEPYTYDPVDHRFVGLFAVMLYSDKNSLNITEVTWTSATPSDQTLLTLLRAPFPRTDLLIFTEWHEFLKLLPDYCTFNYIYARNVYSEVLDAIIERSQECGRLEDIYCGEIFKKRGRQASIDWIATNRRLRRIFNFCFDSPAAILDSSFRAW